MRSAAFVLGLIIVLMYTVCSVISPQSIDAFHHYVRHLIR